MYSPDRKKAFQYTLSCLQDMKLYEFCQKILLVDGRANIRPEGWDVVTVPRVDGKFCWQSAWNKGLENSKFDKVIYLDADRILPNNFIELVLEKLEQNTFIFTSMHFMMLKDVDFLDCDRLFSCFQKGNMCDDDFLGLFRYEERYKHPVHGPGKNVMSGSVGFMKEDYYRIGGVDPWYCGHGAYADTDFHYNAYKNGIDFIDLKIPEFHYYHNKKSNNGKNLSTMKLRRLSLYNFIYYCNKWGVSIDMVEKVANECNLKHPKSYIKKILNDIKSTLT